MNYQRNKALAKTRNSRPTMTDQAAAVTTDINVIVRQFARTGQAPGVGAQPMYGDFTGLPSNLRDMLHAARNMDQAREKLPEKLRNMPLDELFALKPEEIKAILTPAQPNAQQPTEEPKE